MEAHIMNSDESITKNYHKDAIKNMVKNTIDKRDTLRMIASLMGNMCFMM